MCEENDKNFQGFLLRRIATDTMRLSGWFTNIYCYWKEKIISFLQLKHIINILAIIGFCSLQKKKKNENWKIVQQVNLSFEFDISA